MNGVELLISMQPVFALYAPELGVDWTILAGQCMTESSGIPDVIGLAGEIGLAQIKLSTAKDMDENITEKEMFIPERNVEIQTKYLKWLKKYLYDECDIVDDFKWVLAAYNWGIGNVARLLKQNKSWGDVPKNVRDYVSRIYRYAELIEDEYLMRFQNHT